MRPVQCYATKNNIAAPRRDIVFCPIAKYGDARDAPFIWGHEVSVMQFCSCSRIALSVRWGAGSYGIRPRFKSGTRNLAIARYGELASAKTRLCEPSAGCKADFRQNFGPLFALTGMFYWKNMLPLLRRFGKYRSHSYSIRVRWTSRYRSSNS